MTPEERAELLRIVKSVVKFGDFTLSSGKKSDFYIDCRLVTLNARGLLLTARAMLEIIRPLRPVAVGGLAVGADPLSAGVAVESAREGDPIDAFIVRKEAKGHGTKKSIEGPPLARGARVIALDDVVTTGGSTVQAIERLREEAGADVIAAVALVDREEGGKEALAAMGVPLHAVFRKSELR
ncbi:MAG: orotate phosphoribosyltransferase [Candidatus Brocadiae bacterium]|nr:orotate phosphoribosyltransferase [Candidatus Brocadiia bacterium]